MAISFKTALRQLGGVDDDWRYSQFVQQIANIPLGEFSSRELWHMERVCSAFMTAIRAERYEKAGVTGSDISPDSPFKDWDYAHTREDKFTGRRLHMAELIAMNEETIRSLNYLAQNGWRIWISPCDTVTEAGYRMAIGAAPAKDLGEDEYPKFDIPAD